MCQQDGYFHTVTSVRCTVHTCYIIPFSPHTNVISSVLTLHIFVSAATWFMYMCTLLVCFFVPWSETDELGVGHIQQGGLSVAQEQGCRTSLIHAH